MISVSPARGTPVALLLAALLLAASVVWAPPTLARTLVPMDLSQRDHLRAYGLAYWCLEQGFNVEWLLNYRGGSFLTPASDLIRREAAIRGVSLEEIEGSALAQLYQTIEEENMEKIVLEKAPAVAVYVPPTVEPWDDAVRLVLEYSEIPYTTVYDREVLAGTLDEYDWLHLHHEDFTGQYGKFYASFRNAEWYVQAQRAAEALAREAGFSKVSEHKKAVAQVIESYVARGGFLFAMCSATDTYDIALAAMGTDICQAVFDGDPPAPDFPGRLSYDRCLAFTHFTLIPDPMVYEYSNIDTSEEAIRRGPEAEYFTLFDFSAKYDPLPCMLCQDHVSVVKGFLGQTSGFHRQVLKESVRILGEVEGTDEVKYVHGVLGRGTFTFLGGHDPEDYQHAVGDPPTDVSLHPNSAGYRLILNNILFPAAQKKERKT